MNKFFITLLFLSFVTFSGTAQEVTNDSIFANLILDSVVIRDTRLDIKDFIRKCQTDQTFYRAFRTLRKISYTSYNDIALYDKKKRIKASYNSRSEQAFKENCRTMQFFEEKTTGDYFDKKRQPNYYTATLFDRLFLTHGKVCEGENVADTMRYGNEDSRTAGYINDLKKLIFRPGEKIDVPIIGKKTAIFSEKMRPYYDYSLTSKMYKGKTDCYVFSVIPKKETDEDDTVIKSLETYFAKNNNYQIVGRAYRLQYSGTLFSFDVVMNIELDKIDNAYLPTYISYEGFWDIALRKPERAKFSAEFVGFE